MRVLQSQERANRCGFCDRALYPEGAAEVLIGDARTNPLETGEDITNARALADKGKLTPPHIRKACTIGGGAPQ